MRRLKTRLTRRPPVAKQKHRIFNSQILSINILLSAVSIKKSREIFKKIEKDIRIHEFINPQRFNNLITANSNHFEIIS
jgi:hypothetical protein